MYPSSNSSSASQPSNTINGGSHGAGGIGLARYRSAPVSFLNTTADSVVNGSEAGQQQRTVGNHMVNSGGTAGTPTRFFSPPDTTSSQLSSQATSFRLNEFATAFNGLKPANQSSSPLFRHGSSPAGFLNTLVSSAPATETQKIDQVVDQIKMFTKKALYWLPDVHIDLKKVAHMY
ncbi:hypothetical protein E3N88_25014 [Mikania micrantha]|uniref:Uncharacterized protein n=1 Tax=Mikania micrantha TaxID=192012 RepID=A0A5N6N4Y8_9ASTR|nr:hypothetical protein E3N88_25014 [Mikania micrantha]